jgi:E3 ubiquitin-protein ligase HERC1
MLLFLLTNLKLLVTNLKSKNLCAIQDGIRAAKRNIQIEIQVAVHKIYQQLSATLERALQANKHHIGECDR